MDKRFALILVAVFAVIAGVFFLSKDKASSPSNSSGAAVSNHSIGAGSTGVELIEYGDFQCPACGSFYPIIKQIEEKYGDQIKFTFKHYPIDSIHPNARAAHRAAEASGMQNKFFEMHDLLYENQSSWKDLTNPISLFESYAGQLGLDLEKFKTDFASETVNDIINADTAEGKDTYKVNSTPSFILEGQKLDNSELGSFELFVNKIDDAIFNNKTP